MSVGDKAVWVEEVVRGSNGHRCWEVVDGSEEVAGGEGLVGIALYCSANAWDPMHEIEFKCWGKSEACCLWHICRRKSRKWLLGNALINYLVCLETIYIVKIEFIFAEST